MSPGRLQQANALLEMTNYAANIAGSTVAGILVATAGAGVAIAVDAATFAVSAVFLVLLRPVVVERPGQREGFLAELAGGWHEFRSRRRLWVGVTGASLYLFGVVTPFWVLGPVVAQDHYGGAGAWALIMAGFGVGAVAGATLALRWRPVRPLLVGAGAALLLSPWPFVALAQIACGAAMALFATLWETTIQQHIPEDKLSPVSSYDWLGSIAFLPAGFVLAGPVSAAIGVSTTLWCSAALAVGSAAMMLAVRDLRDLRSRAPAAAPEPLAA